MAHFDAVNFALAIERFDPLLHQPQPPGYLLAVALLRGLAALGVEARDALLLAGVIAGATAVWFLWSLAERMGGTPMAFYACSLLLFHPFTLLTGMRSPLRLWLAAGACAVAYFSWRGLAGEGKQWFRGAAVALAIAAGFRPEAMLLLFPLALLPLQSRRYPVREALRAAALAIPVALAWLVPLTHAFGGWRDFGFVLWHYLREQFGGSSALFGADCTQALGMAVKALTWVALGTLCWLWALPWVLWHRKAAAPPGSARFFLVWIVPAALFYAFVHVGDPEHTLATAPAVSLLGGWILTQWAAGSRPRAVLAGALACGLSLGLFLSPESAWGGQYWAARRAACETAAVVESLREQARAAPLFVVSWEGAGLWRQVSYHLPESSVLVLHGAPEQPGLEARHMFYRNRRRGQPPLEGTRIRVPAGSQVFVLAPKGWQPSAEEGPLRKLNPGIGLFQLEAGESRRLGAYLVAWERPALEPGPVDAGE
ncbi:MAG: glycosyltransferase family 39 protein [Bryobacteraceae bacterium]|nr:glycosyltransferase family 39 protein [Bryobacteraceae bacterium]